MDANKLTKLREMGYRIPKVCGLCTWCSHTMAGSTWGVCLINKYKHLKHTGEERCVSISIYGTCPKFKLSGRPHDRLLYFDEFLES